MVQLNGLTYNIGEDTLQVLFTAIVLIVLVMAVLSRFWKLYPLKLWEVKW